MCLKASPPARHLCVPVYGFLLDLVFQLTIFSYALCWFGVKVTSVHTGLDGGFNLSLLHLSPCGDSRQVLRVLPWCITSVSDRVTRSTGPIDKIIQSSIQLTVVCCAELQLYNLKHHLAFIQHLLRACAPQECDNAGCYTRCWSVYVPCCCFGVLQKLRMMVVFVQ